jgi:hypothetical protein
MAPDLSYWSSPDCDLNCDGFVELYCRPFDLDGSAYLDAIPDGGVDDFWTFYDGNFDGVCDPEDPFDVVLFEPDGIADGSSCHPTCDRRGTVEAFDTQGASCFIERADLDGDGIPDLGYDPPGNQWGVPLDGIDVIGGRVDNLRLVGGQVDLGTVTCVARDIGYTLLDVRDGPDPPVGNAFFLLFRRSNPLDGAEGSYASACQTPRVVQPGNGDCEPPGGACTFLLTPDARALPGRGGSEAFWIAASEDCPWTLTADDWIVGLCDLGACSGLIQGCLPVGGGLQECAGQGSGFVAFGAGPNPGTPRVGSIRLGSDSVAVFQDSCLDAPLTLDCFPLEPCYFTCDSATQGRNGPPTHCGAFPNVSWGGFQVVRAPASCPWEYTAEALDSWIFIERAEPFPSNDGLPQVWYSLLPNSGTEPRTGTIEVTWSDGTTTFTKPFSVVQLPE